MILDLFICDNTNNILYGNNIKYNNILNNINLSNNNILNNINYNILYNINYNILYNTYTSYGIISYLYVNDIIICILHNDDSFTASKLLLYIKKYIASCGLHMNKESIIHNYFMYVTNLYNINYNI
ncbi:RNA-binding protein predicted [Ecytonucleospora hepatopenaei]|uniref:RNA-binding protein predicted n=1 Tax=Ecytonucleospora hepatopenaei TaxID=646526 RepID=A0A1W0E3X7_9MICR|nr:RNA-binding protein predicted [Ecytonucleospora hepatopenaei]